MMSYSFKPHLDTLFAAQSDRPLQKLYALLDIAQLPKAKNLLQRDVPDALHRLLFAGCFAESALSLSPALVALSTEPEAAARQIIALDASCHQLPIMSLLQTDMTLDILTQHLQSMLIIEADAVPYLLRLADTQMLTATAKILLPAQRAQFFNGLTSWLIVDHLGRLDNLCAQLQEYPATENLPLQLDATQTETLLTAVIVPTLASQVRHLDRTFAQHLTHAQQTEFITSAVAAAHLTGITDDSELTAWTIARWETVRGDGVRV